MSDDRKVEVCEYCSGFDVKELKGKVKASVGCMGKCSKKCPELQGKIYGYLNGAFVVCDTKEDFLQRIDQLEPYVPLSNQNAKVDGFLEHVEQWHEEFQALRKIVLDSELSEDLKWGQPCYTIDGRNVLILGGFKNYIALSFFKGALLKDQQGFLVQQTKNVQEARQFRFSSVDEILKMESVIKEYIKEAIQIEKAGMKVPVVEKEMILPEELVQRFEEDVAFRDAFYSLTPGRQRAYAYYFSSAKQAKTRVSRIEKYVPKILEGKGMDD
jgi:uncharacterized protein YdeI (YjbR/CyaY-like superfamily)